MCPEWDSLPDAAQLALSRAALSHASETFATQAEELATAIERGILADRGGSDALRLLAAAVRVTGRGSVSAPPANC